MRRVWAPNNDGVLMDFADEATRASDLHLADCLARIRRMEGVSAVECDECGEAIPAGRRLAVPGCRFCVACQEALE
jgi:phage/conjugal plasmid C-4 type zinc finger TraR family protein